MDLYYEVQGRGEPMILLHSGKEDLREWQYVVPSLAQSHQVITRDARGFGKSPAVVEPMNPVEDLRELLDHLGLTTTSLVGHSMGGQVATDFALTYPERVSRLVLIAPSLTGFQFSSAFEQRIAQVTAAVPDREKMVELSLAIPSYRVTMAGPQRDFLYRMQKDLMQRIFEWKTFQIDWPQPPAIERLEKLRAKTLFIIGSQDVEDLFHIAEEFKRVSDIRFVTIDGADHMPTLTHPDEVCHLITQFLRE